MFSPLYYRHVNPFRTAVPFRVQTYNLSGVFRKRDCNSKQGWHQPNMFAHASAFKQNQSPCVRRTAFYSAPKMSGDSIFTPLMRDSNFALTCIDWHQTASFECRTLGPTPFTRARVALLDMTHDIFALRRPCELFCVTPEIERHALRDHVITTPRNGESSLFYTRKVGFGRKREWAGDWAMSSWYVTNSPVLPLWRFLINLGEINHMVWYVVYWNWWF